MKKVILFIGLLMCSSCKTYFLNNSLQEKGIFDSKIKLKRLTYESQHIVFFPIAHIGTKLFYEDVKLKIDSLKARGYYFYFEEMKVDSDDTLTLRKFRKIFKLPIPQYGYKETIDTVFSKSMKLKYEIVNQPSYKEFGLDSTIGRNVDVSLKEVVAEYERLHNEIILEACDYKTTVYQVSTCDDEKSTPRVGKDVMVDFRNNYVLKNLKNEKRSKIAIIYGRGHFPGIAEELKKLEYKEYQ